jgi:hypothetical protein
VVDAYDRKIKPAQIREQFENERPRLVSESELSGLLKGDLISSARRLCETGYLAFLIPKRAPRS